MTTPSTDYQGWSHQKNLNSNAYIKVLDEQTTKTSDAYILGLRKSHLKADAFRVIRNMLIQGSSSISTWEAAFPYEDVDNSSTYPIGIIEITSISWEKFSLKRKTAMIDFTITIYDDEAKNSDDLYDETVNIIETKRPTLYGFDLKSINLTGSTEGHIVRSGIKVFSREANFSAEFIFTKSYP